MKEYIKEVLKEIREHASARAWCNDWGRKMGIYGNTNYGIPAGDDDDLDAFRHAFFSAVLVAYTPLDFFGLDKLIVETLGDLNEDVNSKHKCSREMDIYNNRLGREVAPDTVQVIKWILGPERLHEEIAKIVARAVKSGKTINDLGDSRMSAACQTKYNKKKTRNKKSKKEGQYIWRTSGDNKVRGSHAMREGKVFSWDNPPEGGHPGEDYGCRCTAEPYPNENTPYLKKIFER